MPKLLTPTSSTIPLLVTSPFWISKKGSSLYTLIPKSCAFAYTSSIFCSLTAFCNAIFSFSWIGSNISGLVDHGCFWDGDISVMSWPAALCVIGAEDQYCHLITPSGVISGTFSGNAFSTGCNFVCTSLLILSFLAAVAVASRSACTFALISAGTSYFAEYHHGTWYHFICLSTSFSKSANMMPFSLFLFRKSFTALIPMTFSASHAAAPKFPVTMFVIADTISFAPKNHAV